MNQRRSTPTPSAARLAGDEYQHLYTWFHALHLLREAEAVTRIEFEAQDAGNVDDLIVHRRDAPPLYHQIKFVVDQRAPLNHEWFTTIPPRAKRSPLQRFHASFELLSSESGRPELALLTNRQPAAGDPILKHIGGRTDKLVPRIEEPSKRSATGKARAGWAAHLCITEEQLLEMLTHLRILPGRGSFDELRKHCGVYMEAVGLRGDVHAVDIGIDEIRRLIIEGCSSLEREALHEIIRAKGLHAVAPRATLLIQAIDTHPWPEIATASIDWIELFEGDESRSRRQLRDPRLWNAQLAEDLRAAATAIRGEGFDRIHLDGAFRLSTGFAAGAALPRAAGLTVSFRDWASDAVTAPGKVSTTLTELGRGADIAIGISVTADLSRDVLDYIEHAQLPVDAFVNITPTAGPRQDAIPDAAAAVGFAYAAFSAIREATRQTTGTLHLFLCGPNGLAILLGHLWNRVPTTQLYDDANSPEGYLPTFELAS